MQTVLLLALQRAAADAERPLLSANITLWEAATAAAVGRCTHEFSALNPSHTVLRLRQPPQPGCRRSRCVLSGSGCGGAGAFAFRAAFVSGCFFSTSDRLQPLLLTSFPPHQSWRPTMLFLLEQPGRHARYGVGRGADRGVAAGLRRRLPALRILAAGASAAIRLLSCSVS